MVQDAIRPTTLAPPRTLVQIPNQITRHHAIMLRDRYVLARDKVMAIELEARLIIVGTLGVVVKRPSTAPTVHEMSYLVFLP
jgi:hypothetical protein